MTGNKKIDDMRLGVLREILEDPGGDDAVTARTVLADFLEEHEPHCTSQLLRESPGVWEVRNFELYWVLSEPYSQWTKDYIEHTNEIRRSYKESEREAEEHPFIWIFTTHWSGQKCTCCCIGLGSGLWNTDCWEHRGWWCHSCNEDSKFLIRILEQERFTHPVYDTARTEIKRQKRIWKAHWDRAELIRQGKIIDPSFTSLTYLDVLRGSPLRVHAAIIKEQARVSEQFRQALAVPLATQYSLGPDVEEDT